METDVTTIIEWLTIGLAICGALAHLVRFTPSLRDDEALGALRHVLSLLLTALQMLAGNYGKTRNVAPVESPKELNGTPIAPQQPRADW